METYGHWEYGSYDWVGSYIICPAVTWEWIFFWLILSGSQTHAEGSSFYIYLGVKQNGKDSAPIANLSFPLNLGVYKLGG